MALLKIGVMVSGRGSNLQAIIDGIESGDLAVELALVVSNRPRAMALERGRRHGAPVAVLERSDYSSRHDRDLAIVACLQEAAVDLVVLAGYDQLIDDDLLRVFAGRIVNIHPSLLPAFAGGLHAQREAVEYGVKIAGCTVHFVEPGPPDGGPIILQRAVPVLDDDTEESLAERILREEHKALPQAIRLLAEKRVAVEGRRVRIS